MLTVPRFPLKPCCAHGHIFSPLTLLAPLPRMPFPFHFTWPTVAQDSSQFSLSPSLTARREPGVPWRSGHLVLTSITTLYKALCVVSLSGWEAVTVRAVLFILRMTCFLAHSRCSENVELKWIALLEGVKYVLGIVLDGVAYVQK